MRLAIIGDVHSNIFALESVLADIEKRNVDFIVSTGDLVGYMPFPNEVINAIRGKKILSIQGNHDRAIAQGEPVTDEKIKRLSQEDVQKSASAAFTNWAITDDNRDYLSHLPSQIQLNCHGFKLVVVHGSPRAIGEYLYEDKEKLELLAKEIEEDIVICGHTHVPYHVTVLGKHFINAGSVGKPKHGNDQSAYVIVEVEKNKVFSEIIKVTYDVEGMIKAIKQNDYSADSLIPMLKEGF